MNDDVSRQGSITLAVTVPGHSCYQGRRPSITDARTLKAAKPTTLKPVEYIQIPEEYRVFG